MLDDALEILSATLLDKFADVKERSCQAIVALTRALPLTFSMKGPARLLNPLAQIMAHQQKKVRMATIQAVGESYHDAVLRIVVS